VELSPHFHAWRVARENLVQPGWLLFFETTWIERFYTVIVTCEECNTKFRVDDKLVPEKGIKAKCSKCGHIFMIYPPEPEEEDNEGPALSILDEEADVDKSEIAVPSKRPTQPSKAKASVFSRRLFFGAFIGLTVLCLFLLFAYMRTYKSAQVKKEIDPGNKRIVVSSETKEYFIDNIHLGQLFVVQGMVRNEYPQARSFIFLKATLYTGLNKPYQTITLYCGNPLTREQLRTLTLQELFKVVKNKYGKSRANVNVLPNAEVPFTVFFYNLPELSKLTNYKIEVVSSEPYKPSS